MSAAADNLDTRAWLGLGGNVGDVMAALKAALNGLNAMPEIAVTRVSPVYKTPPWGVEDQPWFFNCCAEINTSLSPEELLDACQQMEREGRRMRTIRWGPRTIDVDIVAMAGIEQVEQRLTIPHPRATERAFVIVPLADIAPDLQLGERTVSDWMTVIDQSGIEPATADGSWWS